MRFVGALPLKTRWAFAELDLRGERRSIVVAVAKDVGPATRVASPAPPERRSWVRCRPEDCFGALRNGHPPAGVPERWALIQDLFPGLPLPRPPRGMSKARLLDVLILAWAAREVAGRRFTRGADGYVTPGRFRLLPSLA
jgi:hypothetical protein